MMTCEASLKQARIGLADVKTAERVRRNTAKKERERDDHDQPRARAGGKR
jgi:hypothetical protein